MDSPYSNEAFAITNSETGGTTSCGGGGGGCSIGKRPNTTVAIDEMAVLLIPLVIIAIMKRIG